MLMQSAKTNMDTPNKGLLQKFSWKEYFVLVIAGMIGVVAALPFAWTIMERTANLTKVPVQLLVAGQLVQSTIWMLFTVAVGLFLATKTGLGAPILRPSTCVL